MPEPGTTYLGDGLYASYDGWMLTLTADKGAPVERSVYLEPAVWRALLAYMTGGEE
jgi:hypothetical protein